MIQISQAAVDEIQRLKSKQKQPDLLFRLTIKPGGCYDWFYDMSFNENTTITDDDRLFDCNGIQVVIDTQTAAQIQGLTIEYSEDLMGGGFRFYNPQATTVCGCGNSFSANNED